MAEANKLRTEIGTVPVPDPTVLTTAQTAREINALREILSARMDGIEKVLALLQDQHGEMEKLTDINVANLQMLQNEKFFSIQTQFTERDTRSEQNTRDNRVAIDAALQAAKEAAAAIDEKTAHLQALHDEKFRSIAVQFIERDVRTDQTSRDSKVAVDAALQAAKEAVGAQNTSSALAIAKSEASTAKQIDQQALLIATSTKGLEDKINDLKERLSSREGRETGSQVQQSTHTTSSSLMVAIAVASMSLVALIIMIAEKLAK